MNWIVTEKPAHYFNLKAWIIMDQTDGDVHSDHDTKEEAEKEFKTSSFFQRIRVDDLKQNWRRDPCYDLWDVEGFEEFKDELRAYQESQEKRWAEAAAQELQEYANKIGIPDNTVLAAHIRHLERTIEALTEKLHEHDIY
jgi:hypothetical protein